MSRSNDAAAGAAVESLPTRGMLDPARASRYEWVDRAKGIGIILVVFGHVADGVFRAGIPFPRTVFGPLYAAIYSFHMPLFFLLAGLFFYGSWTRRGTAMLIRSKLDTLAYPYLLWSVVQGSIEVAASRYTTHHASFDSVLALLWHPRQQFWFLYALFFVFVLACFVCALVPRKWHGFVVLLAAVAFVIRAAVPHVGPFYYLAAESVFFFMGMILREWLQRPGIRATAALPLTTVAFLGVQLAYALYRNDLPQLPQGIMDLAVALVSISLVIVLSMVALPPVGRWLFVLGQHSLAIYLMHTIFAAGTRIVLAKFLGIERLDVHLIAGTTLGLGIPLLCARVVAAHGIQGVFAIPSRWRLGAETSSTHELAS
jgi:fucose 4-O-acetylase-like acetyltransferase